MNCFSRVFTALFLLTACEQQQEKVAIPPASELAEKSVVICYSRDLIQDPEFDPDQIDSCVYGNIITRSHGTPDYKGRYFYSYQVFRLQNNKAEPIPNHELFNTKQKELEQILNSKVKVEFAELLIEFQDCFEGFELRSYLLDDFGLALKGNNTIQFNLNFGLPMVCLPADGVIIDLSLAELEPFLLIPPNQK